jgi:hypothetical protein
VPDGESDTLQMDCQDGPKDGALAVQGNVAGTENGLVASTTHMIKAASAVVHNL